MNQLPIFFSDHDLRMAYSNASFVSYFVKQGRSYFGVPQNKEMDKTDLSERSLDDSKTILKVLPDIQVTEQVNGNREVLFGL